MTFLGQVSVLGSGVDCTAVLADVVGDKVGSVGSVRAATVTGRWDRADRQWAAWDAAQQGKTCRFQAVRQKHTKRNSRKESKRDMAKAAKSRDRVRRFDRQLKDEFVRGEDVTAHLEGFFDCDDVDDVSDCGCSCNRDWWKCVYCHDCYYLYVWDRWDEWDDWYHYYYGCGTMEYSRWCFEDDTLEEFYGETREHIHEPLPLPPVQEDLTPLEKRRTQKTRRPYVTRQAKERQTLHLARQKVHKTRSRMRAAARQDKGAFLVDEVNVCGPGGGYTASGPQLGGVGWGHLPKSHPP